MAGSELAYTGIVVAFDLDDTLYPEADYVKSGFRAVAKYAFPLINAEIAAEVEELANKMLQIRNTGVNAFDWLTQYVEADSTVFIAECVDIYRYHTPDITLNPDAKKLLDTLSAIGLRMALITDGRSRTQRAKIKALGIDKFFPPENILISEETGEDKTSLTPWQSLVHHYPEAKKFIYIGDNPAKDFRMPNLLGWLSIGLRDKGNNIHPQDNIPTPSYAPAVWADDLASLHDIILNTSF